MIFTIFFNEKDEKSPAALTKNAGEDEVEISVDNIIPAVFHELVAFVKNCTSETASGRKKKSTTTKSSSKKSRLN